MIAFDEYIRIRKKIRESVPDRTLLEMLAEEASETAQAALKVIRAAKMNESPTPMAESEAWNNLLEEISQMLVCVDALGILNDVVQPFNNGVWHRWEARLDAEDICKKADR